MTGRLSGAAHQDLHTHTGHFQCAADLADWDVPERQWHVEGFLPKRAVTILSGHGGTGKSLVSLQLAVATAMGGNWLGQVTKEGKALYLSAEDELGELHRRLVGITSGQEFGLKRLKELFLLPLAGQEAFLALEDKASKTLIETPLYRHIEKSIATHEPALVVLDTLADLFGGDEINRQHARRFITLLTRLCLQYDTTILLLAHPSLSGLDRGDGGSGSTAWHNSVRSFLNMTVERDTGKNTGADKRVLKVIKSNYGQVGKKLLLSWRQGAFVVDGAYKSLESTGVSDKAVELFTRLLRKHHENGRRLNNASGPNYAPSVFALDKDADGVTRAALRRAMEHALDRGLVRIQTEGPPSRPRSFLVPA